MLLIWLYLVVRSARRVYYRSQSRNSHHERVRNLDDFNPLYDMVFNPVTLRGELSLDVVRYMAVFSFYLLNTLPVDLTPHN